MQRIDLLIRSSYSSDSIRNSANSAYEKLGAAVLANLEGASLAETQDNDEKSILNTHIMKIGKDALQL